MIKIFKYKCNKNIYILWSRRSSIVCSVVQFCQHPPAQPTHQCQYKSSLSGNNWRRQAAELWRSIVHCCCYIHQVSLLSICLLFRQWPVDCGRCRKWSQFANFFLQKLSSHPQQISGLIVVWGWGLGSVERSRLYCYTFAAEAESEKLAARKMLKSFDIICGQQQQATVPVLSGS